MKKLLSLLTFIPVFLLAQNPTDNILWARVLSADYMVSVPTSLLKTDSDGNVLLFNTCYGVVTLDHSSIGLPPTSAEAILFKFDSTGNLLFSKIMPNSSGVKGLVIDRLNNIYVNYYSSTSSSTSVIIKLDSYGNIAWKDSVTNEDILQAPISPIAVDGFGTVYYCGGNNGIPDYFNNDSLFNYGEGLGFFLLKISSGGNLVSSKLFASRDTGIGIASLTSLECNESNNRIYINGANSIGTLVFGSDSISECSFFIELDSDFSLINKYLFGGSSYLFNVTTINFDANNEVYLSAVCSSLNFILESDTMSFPSNVGIVIKLDDQLNHVWHKYVINNPQGIIIRSMSVNSGS